MWLVAFIINTVSTCFVHHYAHHQENKDRVLLHMVFALVVHRCPSLAIVLRCHVEVSVSGRSLVQRCSTECGVCYFDL